MKHLTILAPVGEGNNVSSIVGAYKLFKRANSFWKSTHRADLFRIEVAGTSKKTTYHDGLVSIRPHVSIASISKTDLIIIPSLNHDYEEALKKNKKMIAWIKHQYSCGAEVASICTGAFFSGAAGLLDGKTCSTNWAVEEVFRKLFPNARLQIDKIISDEKGVYTSGGAYSFLNLIIYLIGKYYDRTTAIYCSKVFQVDPGRESQFPFMIFSGQKMHGDEVVKEAQEYIETHIDEKISFEYLSRKLAVGRRNFDRRFIRATGNTPLEYTQRVRVEAAKQALETTSKPVSEVMYDVGYADSKAFREIFRKITGLAPLAYKAKYSKVGTGTQF